LFPWFHSTRRWNPKWKRSNTFGVKKHLLEDRRRSENYCSNTKFLHFLLVLECAFGLQEPEPSWHPCFPIRSKFVKRDWPLPTNQIG
jgi:hypothetical protein